MEGADHGLSNETWHRAYTAILVNWFNEIVFGRKPFEPVSAEKKPPISTTPEAASKEPRPPEA
jgi:hypothetical protein